MDSQKKNIRLYADSLGLPRPGTVDEAGRYFSLLVSWFRNEKKTEVEAIDHSRSEQTIVDLYKWFVEDNRYFNNNIDVLILQVGVVDCAPRPVPRKIRNIISKLPQFLKKIVIKFLHDNRAKLQNFGLKYFIVKPDIFEKYYYDFLELASHLSKRVYVFNIVPTNDEIEARSPGFKKSIENYNALIDKTVNSLNKKNIFLFDMHTQFSSEIGKLDEYVLKEDGHHITSLSHEIYAKKIIAIEEKYSEA